MASMLLSIVVDVGAPVLLGYVGAEIGKGVGVGGGIEEGPETAIAGGAVAEVGGTGIGGLTGGVIAESLDQQIYRFAT